VRALQMLVAEHDSDVLPEALYSSWPLEPDEAVHPQLRGMLKSTEGAQVVSLDGVLQREGIDRVDFIKLDVDGYECDVLRGASRTLAQWRPLLIMEVAHYVLAERGESLDSLLQILRSARYSLYDLTNGRPLWRGVSPSSSDTADGVGFNVIARPD
jgi:hypothetical protein